MPITRPETLSVQVARHLKNEILSGSMPPGSIIVEQTCAEELGVSRVPVREALLDLERIGLVESDERGRNRVPIMDKEDLLEIQQVRYSLEPMAANLLAQRASDFDFSPIEKIVSATERVQSAHELSKVDTEFHDSIIRNCGNRRLLLCWEPICNQVELWLVTMQEQHRRLKRSTVSETVRSHRKLLQIIKRGRSQEAEDEVRRQIGFWDDFVSSIVQSDD